MLQAFVAFSAVAALAAATLSPSLKEPAPLAAEEAKSFVASLDPVAALSKALEAEGKIGALVVEAKPSDKEPFAPCSQAVARLSARHPADLARLGGAVAPYGFTTERWALVGDRVLAAYLAEKSAARESALTNGAARPHLASLHAEPQLHSMFMLLNAEADAPATDRAIVRPLMGGLAARIGGANPLGKTP